MQNTGFFTIAADHPALPGHFPGRPVVPGVILLDHAAALILAGQGSLNAQGFAGVKFLSPVLPTQTVEVRTKLPVDGRYAFACIHHGKTVLTGTLIAGT